jgi:hypothetical protein
MIAGSALGFDGDRKGFILGGGIGFAPISKWSVDVDFFDINVGNAEEEEPAFAVHIMIGGAFDEHNMLVYEGNATGFKSKLLDESISQGFSGAVWYHYFGQPGKTLFTALGLGVHVFQVGDYDAASPGGSLLLGAGYEFARHWQAGAYLSFGKSSDSGMGLEADFEHTQLSFTISTVAF